jgi:peptidoglycan/xylan/chitin deacetylase (PgdA/CDA1 family)
MLRRRGYRGATFSRAVTEPPARRTVAVTFDDAYRSVIELARPILERHGLPASVYVPTAHAGAERPMSWPGIDHWIGTPHEHELTPMSWDELRELANAGWEIGSHTRTHPHLTQLGDEETARELGDSRTEIEDELGLPCDTIAYPYGDVDDRVEDLTRQAGYRTAAALPGSFTHLNVHRYARLGLYHNDGPVRFWLKLARGTRWLGLSRSTVL